MEEIICNTDPISIEDAINLTAVTRKYQKTMLIILIMSASLSEHRLEMAYPNFCRIIAGAIVPDDLRSGIPRFLLTNLANVHVTTKVLNKISLLHGKGLFQRQLVSANTRNLSLLSVQDICRYNTITLQLVGCSAAWFNVILGYYSIVFLMPNLTDYVYLQSIGIYCCELSAIVVVMYVINDIGRKKTTVYFFVTVGLIFFLIALLHYAIDDETTQVLVDGILFLIARTALYGGFYLIYIYTAEMFPTQIRGTAFGICNMAGRIASIAGTNFATLNSLIRSTIILGGIMILTAAVTMLLEETLGNELEEVIESNQQILLNSAEDNRLGRE